MSRDYWWGVGLVAIGAFLLSAWRTKKNVGGTFNCKLTGYWPFVSDLNAAERLMEGGTMDRVGNPLHTLEDFQAGQAPYVSVSGDQDIFPYGQRITIDNWPSVIFRVVDTGSHFHGIHKLYRVAGYEPLDICVAGPDTAINPSLSSATIVEGDSFAANHPSSVQGVQYDKFTGQAVGQG